MRGAFLALALAVATQAAAQDGEWVGERLSDSDFHAVVACAAPPGGECRDALVHWGPADRRNLLIAVMPPEPGYPSAKAAIIDQAVDEAIAEINGVGADIRLRRVNANDYAHIRLTPTQLVEGDETNGHDGFPDGTSIGVGQFQIWWDGNHRLESGAILISSDIQRSHIRSIVLEEIMQTLGLWHDVAGPAYYNRSIFDDDSNLVVTLEGQDRAILLLHYPP